MPPKDQTFQDIFDEDRDLLLRASSKYGVFFDNTLEFNELFQDFLKSASVECWIFAAFLSQIRKHLTLALFSAVRLHHVEAMLNLRYAMESAQNAAYAIAFPNESHFIKDKEGLLDSPKKLKEKRYNWLTS